MPEWAWAFLDALGRLFAATFLGACIGLNREFRSEWAGLRTHALVSLGAAVFVSTTLDIVGSEKGAIARVVQGIASGIGFIGAGTILKLTERQEVRGLTTASSVWMAAAVGAASGLGLYLQAFAGTLLALLILVVLLRLEQLFDRWGRHGGSPGR